MEMRTLTNKVATHTQVNKSTEIALHHQYNAAYVSELPFSLQFSESPIPLVACLETYKAKALTTYE